MRVLSNICNFLDLFEKLTMTARHELSHFLHMSDLSFVEHEKEESSYLMETRLLPRFLSRSLGRKVLNP